MGARNDFDMTVIVTGHNEGRLAHHTMNSLFRAITFAEKSGIHIETVVILDRPDKKTKDYFKHYEKSLKMEEVNFGDTGLSRNYGVKVAESSYVTFLDADDLFGKTWLGFLYERLISEKNNCVFHPEYAVCFEKENLFIRYIGTENDKFNIGDLLENNYWTAFLASKKNLFLKKPFIPTPSGFGYEDWHWICEIIAMDVPIRIVPNTCVFYRKKVKNSRLHNHNFKHVVVPPTKLFEYDVFQNLITKKKTVRK